MSKNSGKSIKNSFEKYKAKLKTKEYQKKMLFNMIFFLSAFVIIFTIDWVTKDSIFNFNELGDKYKVDHGWIGTRSLAHYNTTLFSFINAGSSDGLHHAMTIIMALVFLLLAPHSSNWIIASGIGIIFAGVLGNGIDRMVNGYVRDIIYTPWMDKGTYNFADIFTIGGSVILFIGIMWMLYVDDKKKKVNNKKEV